MFGCNSVYTLYSRNDTLLFTLCTYLEQRFLHASLLFQYKTSNLEVRETKFLSPAKNLIRQLFKSIVLRKQILIIDDILKFTNEPGVNLCKFTYTLYTVSLFKCRCNWEYTHICWVGKFLFYIVEMCMLISYKTMHTLTYHTKSLLYYLFEWTADRHNLAYRLHAWTNLSWYTCKLGKVPTWNLTNQIIELGSLVCTVWCTHLTNLVKCISQSNLCCHKSQRITCCLWCKCRWTTQTSINLNYTIVICLGIECILDITLTYYTEMTYSLNRYLLHKLDLLFCKRTCWSHHNRLTGVDSQRIEVLHACYCKTVIIGITYNLELNLFPSFEGLLDKNLVWESKCTLGQLPETLLIAAYTATEAT